MSSAGLFSSPSVSPGQRLDDCFIIDDSIEGFKDGVPLNCWELEDLLYGFLTPWDMLFSNEDENGFGEVSAAKLGRLVEESDFRTTLATLAGPPALARLQARAALPHCLTYTEFIQIISNKRRESFQLALEDRSMASPLSPGLLPHHSRCSDSKAPPIQPSLPSVRSRLAWRLAGKFLPGEDLEQRKFVSLQYRCLPPPLFIPALTLLQMGIFVYQSVWAAEVPGVSGPVPISSPLIFRSDCRDEFWRFLLYALLHAGWWHLIFNVVVQCVVGIPLEMLHGSPRVFLIYAAGVLAGSLGTSVLDSSVYLVGGSGGVYALLAAHVANVLINFAHIDCGLFYIVMSIVIGSVDVGYAVWNRYAVSSPEDHPVSYLAHFAGGLAGLCVGGGVLRRLGGGGLSWAPIAGLVLFGTLLAVAIVLNIILP